MSRAKESFSIVVRMHAGTWQFYAGTNEALGAPRWSDDPKDAARFESLEDADRVAAKVSGFARRVFKKEAN